MDSISSIRPRFGCKTRVSESQRLNAAKVEVGSANHHDQHHAAALDFTAELLRVRFSLSWP